MEAANNNRTLKINIFFHKNDVHTFEDCISDEIVMDQVTEYRVKSSIGLPGIIYIHDSINNPPEWQTELAKLSEGSIDVEDNISNRAIAVFKYNNRFFSLTFGYGRYMLDLKTIVNNFGLKVAANIIDANKVKSLKSTSYESRVIRIQKDVPISMNQDQFGINKDLEMLKSVSGAPSAESTAKFVVGSDSLVVSRSMKIEDIKESIIFYYDKYHSEDYKNKGFEWIDNVNEVKNQTVITLLNEMLCQDIITEDNSVTIVVNQIVNLEQIQGFVITGIRNNDNPALEVDYKKYTSYLLHEYHRKTNEQILSKLKRDKIVSVDNSNSREKISSVFEGIIFETTYEENTYLLDSGSWYQINPDFSDRITNRLREIPVNSISLPDYITDKDETAYNKRVGEESNNIVTLDSKNFMIRNYGSDSVEPCDLITTNKQLIHVKRRDNGGSSVLSHWAAQGLVSAELLNVESTFREHINKQVEDYFGQNFITSEDRNSDFEIIFGLVIESENEGEIIENVPFFTLVNMHQTINELLRRDFRVSFCRINKINDEQLELQVEK